MILTASFFIPNRAEFAFSQELEILGVDLEKVEKIDSRTLQMLEGRTLRSLNVDPDNEESKIRVVLELNDFPSKSQLESLEEIVVEIEYLRDDLAQVLVSPSKLRDLAAMDLVNYIRQPSYLEPDVISEGASLIGSTAINSAGFLGQDVKVAIIDVGFDGTHPEIASNVVDTRSFRIDGNLEGGDPDHGTAVAEIIVDIAPQVELYLYNVGTEIELLNALDYILNQDEVDIVSMSLRLTYGPLDGTSAVSQAVDALKNNGILFVVSAGNSAQNHWEGAYTDPDFNGFHNFADNDELLAITAEKGKLVEVVLSWNNWPSSNEDFDLYVLDNSGIVVAWSNSVQNPGPPSEIIDFVPGYTGTYQIAISKFSSSNVVEFDLFTNTPLAEYRMPSGSIAIPADAEGSLTVGAFSWNTGILENFSSRGPTNDDRIKPDIIAPDGVSTSSISPFFGTSASAPHVAGVAALIKDVYPGVDADILRSLLEENTSDNHIKNNNDGTGKLDAQFLIRNIPVADAGVDQIVDEGAIAVLNATGSKDTDGLISSFLWEQIAEIPSIPIDNANSQIASFSAPQVSEDSQFTFKVTVVDDMGASSSDIVNVMVRDVNAAPVVSAGVDQIVNENDFVSLNGTIFDKSVAGLTWSWMQKSGTPVVLSNPNEQDPSFVAPAVNANTNLTFEFSASNEYNISSNDTVDILVRNFNLPPTAQNRTVSINEDSNPVNITLFATDVDLGTQLIFYVNSLPTFGDLLALGESRTSLGAVLDGLQKTPPVNTTATGHGEFDYNNATNVLSFNIQYTGLTSAELSAFIEGPANMGFVDPELFILPEGSSKMGSIDLDTLADPEAAETDLLLGLWYVNINSENNPSGELRGQIIPSIGSTALVRYAPDADFHGRDSFLFTASDGHFSTLGNMTMIVQSINDPPIANAGLDQRFFAGSVGSLDGSASLDDSAIVSYFWNQTNGKPIIDLSDPFEISPTFVVPNLSENSTIEFSLTVTDQDGMTDSDKVSLFLIDSGSSVSGRVIIDADKDGLFDQEEIGQSGITILLSGLQNQTVITNDDGMFIFEKVPQGFYLLKEKIPLGFHQTFPANNTFAITISALGQQVQEMNFANAPNALPIVDAGLDQVVTENALVELNATVSDDFAGVKLLWTQKSGPAIAFSNAVHEDPTFIAPSVPSQTDIELELVATDSDGGQVSDTIKILVNNSNQPPSANAGLDQTVEEDDSVILDGGASSDSDGSLVSFRWQQKSGPLVSLNDPNSISPVFIAPDVSQDSIIITFQLNVTDNDGAVDTDLVDIIVSDVRVSSQSGRGGGGGGGGGGFVSTQSQGFPASYFVNNPLAKVMFLNTAFFDGFGSSILQATEGQQIQIESILQNQQLESQDYAYILQVINQEGVALDIGIQHGNVNGGDSIKVGQTWLARQAGEYTIQLFVWDNVSRSAIPLSLVQERILIVT